MVKSRLYDKTVVNFSLKFVPILANFAQKFMPILANFIPKIVPILAKIAVCVFNFTKEGEFLV